MVNDFYKQICPTCKLSEKFILWIYFKFYPQQHTQIIIISKRIDTWNSREASLNASQCTCDIFVNDSKTCVVRALRLASRNFFFVTQRQTHGWIDGQSLIVITWVWLKDWGYPVLICWVMASIAPQKLLSWLIKNRFDIKSNRYLNF